jgi:hypothetical protein
MWLSWYSGMFRFFSKSRLACHFYHEIVPVPPHLQTLTQTSLKWECQGYILCSFFCKLKIKLAFNVCTNIPIHINRVRMFQYNIHCKMFKSGWTCLSSNIYHFLEGENFQTTLLLAFWNVQFIIFSYDSNVPRACKSTPKPLAPVYHQVSLMDFSHHSCPPCSPAFGHRHSVLLKNPNTKRSQDRRSQR